MFKFLYNLRGEQRYRLMRKYWHIADKGLIALTNKELLPINKRKTFIFQKWTKEMSRRCQPKEI